MHLLEAFCVRHLFFFMAVVTQISIVVSLTLPVPCLVFVLYMCPYSAMCSTVMIVYVFLQLNL